MSLYSRIFGDPNAKEVAKIRKVIDQVNALGPSIETLSNEGLKAKTTEFKEFLAQGKTLDELLPEAFAVAREMSARVLKQRQYDVQLIGGVALHSGSIAEMRTGEGKTLTAVAPVYLNALTGKGVHLITVNDYLARRDAVWMGQVYHALGLTVGIIQHQGGFRYDPEFKNETAHDEERDTTGSFRVDSDYLRPVSRREACRNCWRPSRRRVRSCQPARVSSWRRPSPKARSPISRPPTRRSVLSWSSASARWICSMSRGCGPSSTPALA